MIVVGLLGLAAPSVAVPAQTTIRTTTDLVVVPALVHQGTDALHQPFTARDFLLTDNGVPQAVHLDEIERQPLSIVVLMQTGASAPRHFADYTRLGTMLRYLSANREHAVSLVTFDSQPEEQWDFTSNVSDLDDGFSHPTPGDAKAAVFDAVAYGISLLKGAPKNYRRLILLLSQTHDEGSRMREEEIVKRLGQNNVTIDCLGFSPEKTWLKDQFTRERHENAPYLYGANGPLLLHTFNLDQPLRMALSALRENEASGIAAMSGGGYFPFATKADLDRDLSELTNQLAATVTLSFTPSSKQPGFHTLDLRVAGHPELKVSFRTSYWADDGKPGASCCSAVPHP